MTAGWPPNSSFPLSLDWGSHQFDRCPMIGRSADVAARNRPGLIICAAAISVMGLPAANRRIRIPVGGV